jgi:hypothetical protein
MDDSLDDAGRGWSRVIASPVTTLSFSGRRAFSNCKSPQARVQSVYSSKVGMGPMEFLNDNRLKRATEGRPWALRATSLVCLLLLTLVTFVLVAHVHPAAADADHCPICVVMHSAAPVAVVAAAIVFVRDSVPVPAPVVHSVVRPWHCTMFNRPPPKDA